MSTESCSPRSLSGEVKEAARFLDTEVDRATLRRYEVLQPFARTPLGPVGESWQLLIDIDRYGLTMLNTDFYMQDSWTYHQTAVCSHGSSLYIDQTRYRAVEIFTWLFSALTRSIPQPYGITRLVASDGDQSSAQRAEEVAARKPRFFDPLTGK